MAHLIPRAFLHRGEGRQEKTLGWADHRIFKHPEKLAVMLALLGVKN